MPSLETQYPTNTFCHYGPPEFVDNVQKYYYVYQGEIRRFLFHKPSLNTFLWNTKRLILTNQKKALELQTQRDKPYLMGTPQTKLFKESEIVIWEGQAVNAPCMLLNAEEEFIQEDNGADSIVDVFIVAITSVQNTKPIGGRIAQFYLSALEAMLTTFPETEFIWRPPDEDGEESEFERGAWQAQRPSIIRQSCISRLDSASFGGEQLAGQFALTIRLRLTAGLA